MEAEDLIIDHQPAPEEVQAETPVEETAPETAPEVEEQSEEGEEEEEPAPKRKTGIQRLREKHMRLEAELQALKRQQQPEKAPEVPELKKPRMEDFETLEAYEAANETYLEAKILKRVEAQKHIEQQQTREQERNQKIQSAISEARTKYADLDDHIETIRDMGLPLPNEVAHAVAREGASLLYELVKDADRYADLVSKDPADMVYEIASIAASLKTGKTKEVKKSTAPKPISPVKPTAIPDSFKPKRDDVEFY